MATLYIVATPIGNLKDITFRALSVLKNVDLILCEDTRITKKLLSHYGIRTKTLSYHQHSKLQKIDYIIGLLKQNKNLALVSDAGTPGISDPGNKLIKELAEAGFSSLEVVPVSGASAVISAASVSGFSMDRFLFLGFPPAKKKREKFFEEVINSKYPVIFYESPYRIIKSLRDLAEVDAKIEINAKQARNIMVCRELTKKFETIYRGTIKGVTKEIEKNKIKGEFTVIVGPRER